MVTQAMILAAGQSTRLGSLGGLRPKPMLPVCNVPLIRWSIALCRHFGVDRFAVNLHHLGQQIREELRNDGQLPLEVVSFSDETDLILGTGGGIRRMATLLPRASTLVCNGKIVCDVDLAAVERFHREHKALATLVVVPHPQAARWGPVTVTDGGEISGLLGRESPRAGGGIDHLFSGVHLIEPDVIDALPDGPSCIVRDGYLKLLASGARLSAYVHRGYFYEHSTPGRYLQGNLNLLGADTSFPARPGPLSGVDSTAKISPSAVLREPILIGPGCQIQDAAIVGPQAVLGEGAIVDPGVALSECVVWPCARVRDSTRRAIVTGGEVVLVQQEGDPFDAPRAGGG
jgi:NDP-sugar pyrophosphorylase family protein